MFSIILNVEKINKERKKVCGSHLTECARARRGGVHKLDRLVQQQKNIFQSKTV